MALYILPEESLKCRFEQGVYRHNTQNTTEFLE